MTDEMVVVQWADLTGTGFSQQRRDNDAPAEYWAAAEGLLAADLAQPPEGILDTGQHPVWTLRRVPVGRRRTWCFVVQGRRGDPDFGVAGTCRFAFALGELEAGEAWRRGIEATGVRAAERHMSDVDFAAGVRQVLRSVVAGQDRIPVGLGPADTAWVIACVLGVLPEPEARTWSWSTCVLLPPGRTKRREVSGSWPDEFLSWEPRLGHAVAASFAEPGATTQDIRRVLDPTRIEGFEELVEQVVRGKAEHALRRDSRDLAEVISRIGRSARKPRIDDVAEMVVAPMGAAELNDHFPRLLSDWAAKRPDEAARQLRHVTHPGAVRRIVGKLLTAQQQDPRNLLGLPTAASPWPDPWHRRLVEILTGLCPPRELERSVAWWLDGVWADPDDAAAARDFLRALGLNERGHPQFYRARPGVIVEQLNLFREVTEAVRTELDLDPDPLSLLANLCPDLRRLPAATVVDLIRAADRPNAARPGDGAAAFESIAAGLTRVRLPHEPVAETEAWVRGLVAQVQSDHRLAGHLLAGGLRALREEDAEAPHDALLEVCLRVRAHASLPADTQTAISAAERRSTPMRVPAQPAMARATVRQQEPRPPSRPRPRFGQLDARRKQQLKWVAGGLAATSVVVALTIAMAILTRPDAGREPAVRNTPAGQPSPRGHLETVTLPAVSPGQQAADTRTIDQRVTAGHVAAVILLTDERPDAADRVRRLSDHLRVNHPHVPHRTLPGADPNVPAQHGTLQVIIVYSK